MKANQGLDRLTDYKHPPAPFKGETRRKSNNVLLINNYYFSTLDLYYELRVNS